MIAETPPNPPNHRVRSLSIGQMTFGSFMLVLAVIVVTGAASVIAIRHIDQTFGELQRLQSVGDLAEDIDRRMNELRLAARDFVTDSSAQPTQIAEIAREVLGTEGRLIQRVTELLREVSDRRGHVLARDFARTLAEAKWQSIVLGSMGVLIGLFAAALVVRRTVRPLARIATSIR